jgi:hypothetical protein
MKREFVESLQDCIVQTTWHVRPAPRLMTSKSYFNFNCLHEKEPRGNGGAVSPKQAFRLSLKGSLLGRLESE